MTDAVVRWALIALAAIVLAAAVVAVIGRALWQ